MSALERFVQSLAAIRVVDAVDIVLVATLCYVAITWFRRARSRFVLMGLGAMAILYAVAAVLDLTLTLIIFRALITVALVALVIIFQEEIRRAFERIATGAPMRGVVPARPDAVAMVVRSMAALARAKTGALVVFRGKEPLARHLTGGVALDGEISEQLLDSLFDPSSAGHDGAVLVEGGRISRFAVHLPLAAAEDVKRGLRHAAARGISERSDAFVVVVSEERGVISVAVGGTLREVSPSELERDLASFMDELAPEAARPRVRAWFASNFAEKGLALLLAVGAWVLVFREQSQQITQSFLIPIEYREVGDPWRLAPPEPREARVVLSGSNRAFQKLDGADLVLSLDVSGVRPGVQVRTLTDEDLALPKGLSVQSIHPREVTVDATELVDVETAIQPKTTGKVDPSVALVRVRVEPAKVRIRLPKAALGQLGQVQTEPVALDGVKESGRFRVGLVLPSKAQLPGDVSPEVELVVEVAPRSSPAPRPSALDPPPGDGDP